jgi:hypothetical protein
MRILSIRTKIEAVIALCIIMVIAGMGIEAAVRTISNTNDNLSTFITTSNGGIYDLTGANLQLAINSMNNASGVVTLPGGGNISISTTIQLYDNVELDMNNCFLWATANVDIINMHKLSKIHDGTIRVSGVSTYSHSAINITGIPTSFYTSPGQYSGRVYNMKLISAGQRGFGIHMFIADTSTAQEIAYWQIDTISTYRFNRSFFLQNNWRTGGGDTAWCNGNMFSNLVGYGDYIFIDLDSNVDEGASNLQGIDGNFFINIQNEPSQSSPYSYIGIRIEGDYNYFDGVMLWDSAGFTNSGVYITSTSDHNSVYGLVTPVTNNGGSTNYYGRPT